MKRTIAIVLIVGVAALAVTGTATAGGDLKAAEAKATRVASNYVKMFGIHFPSRYWKASCNHKDGNLWKCRV
jgi:hypothetical protein